MALIAALVAVVIVGGVFIFRAITGPAVVPNGRGMSEKPAEPAAPKPARRPTTHPAAKKWFSQYAYEDNLGRLVSCCNIDADMMYDADEIVLYGTLRYDEKTCGSAPRITPPAQVNPNDMDGDGLSDAWERGYFGKLDLGWEDDPDGDGFPNGVEYDRRTSPVEIDLADPKLKPKAFVSGPPAPAGRRTFSMDTAQFWAAQAKAAERVKKGDKGPGPAVKGFIWKGPPPGPVPATASTAPTPEQVRFAALARGALSEKLDSDADGLLDAWEMYTIGNLSQGRQDDPDGDGLPNVIEWYQGTNPLKPELMDPALRPADLEDLPPPTTPWDLCWDIHSRMFWRIQDVLRATLNAAGSTSRAAK